MLSRDAAWCAYTEWRNVCDDEGVPTLITRVFVGPVDGDLQCVDSLHGKFVERIWFSDGPAISLIVEEDDEKPHVVDPSDASVLCTYNTFPQERTLPLPAWHHACKFHIVSAERLAFHFEDRSVLLAPPHDFNAWSLKKLAHTRDHRLAAGGDPHGATHVWDTMTGKCLRTLHAEDHKPPISGVVFSDDGSCLIVASLSGMVRVWDTADWQLRASLTDVEDHKTTTTVFATRASTALVVRSNAEIAHSTSLDLVTGVTKTTEMHTKSIVRAVALTPDASRAIFVTRRGHVHTWSL